MSSAPCTHPGDSWVIDDAEDDRISWAEESEGSGGEERLTQAQFKQSHKRAHEHDTQRLHGQSTASEFIMPSIVERPVQRKQTYQPVRARGPASSPKVLQPRTVNMKSIPRQSHKVRPVDDSPSYLMLGVNFILELLGSSLRNLKTPISWVISAYLFFGAIIFLRNLVTSSISNALSPICRLPGVSHLNIPICTYHSRYPDPPTIQPSAANQVDPEFDALITIQSKFDALLSDTTSSSALSLPYDMKRSESSIRDLRLHVRHSSIPSKIELLHELDGFVETAGAASWALTRFNGHVGRCVDLVLVTARWTQRTLDDIADKEIEKSNRGLIPSFIQDAILAPFQPVPFTEAKILDQYIRYSHSISDEISNLLQEAQSLLKILVNLEDRLDEIHGISLRANMVAETDRDEILSELWTILGGNRDRLGKAHKRMALLKDVGEQRKLAFAHVAGTIVKLQSMDAELDELRTRVDDPEAQRDKGVEGVPLSVHIETVKLGVERLQAHRDEARKVREGYDRGKLDAVQKDRDDGGLLMVDG